MPLFSYKARDSAGKETAGVLTAETQEAVAERLLEMGYLATQIVPQSEKPMEQRDLFERFQKVSPREYVLLATHLGNAVESNLPLLKVLEVLADQVSTNKMRVALKQIAADIMSGSSLVGAMRKHPSIFDDYFLNLVNVGEISGKLPQSLHRLADTIEKETEFKQRVGSALMYPILLTCVATAVIVFLTVVILPQFAKVFQESKIPMPLPTQILMAISGFLRRFWYIPIGLGVGFRVAFGRFVATEHGRFRFDRFKLRLPKYGELQKKICITRFMRTLATLYSSGVPIIKSLQIVEETIGNAVYKQALQKVGKEVTGGGHLAEALQQSGLFPPDSLLVVSSGEASGKLGEMLDKGADLYDKEVDYALRTFTALLEPLIILGMGIAVSFVAMAIMLPLFQMTQSM